MYCPKCGHQQVSDEVHYCSRCGFTLKGILTVRRKEIKQGALLMLIGALWFIFFNGFVDGWKTAGGEVGSSNISLVIIVNVIPSIIFLLGLARVLYTAVEEARARRKEQEARLSSAPRDTKDLGSAPRGQSLPAFQSVEISKQRGTAEIMRPPSVTEESTRLLRNRPDPEHQ